MALTLGIPRKYNEMALYLAIAAAIAIGTYLILHSLAGGVLHGHFIPDNPSPTYSQGHLIEFGVTNLGKKPLVLPGTNPWEILDSNLGVIFQPDNISDAQQPLLGQHSAQWSWDQRLSNGQLLLPGSYSIKIDYLDGGKPAAVVIHFSVD